MCQCLLYHSCVLKVCSRTWKGNFNFNQAPKPSEKFTLNDRCTHGDSRVLLCPFLLYGSHENDRESVIRTSFIWTRHLCHSSATPMPMLWEIQAPSTDPKYSGLIPRAPSSGSGTIRELDRSLVVDLVALVDTRGEACLTDARATHFMLILIYEFMHLCQGSSINWNMA